MKRMRLPLLALTALVLACPAARPRDETTDDGAEGTGPAVPVEPEPTTTAAASGSSSSSSSGDGDGDGDGSASCEDKLAKAQADLAACTAASK